MAPLAVKRLSEIRNRRQETALALQRATKTIPIVATVSDMLGSGLVTSLARPDGNITGVSIAGEADGKRQDILIEAVPRPRLMAVLTDPDNATLAKLDALEEAARAHNVCFQFIV